MRGRIPRLCASFGVILILASMTGSCGRRGRLLPPPDPDNPFALAAPPAPAGTKTAPDATKTEAAGTQTAADATKTAADGTANAVTKSGLHRRPSNPPIRPPNQPFILDPML